MKDRKDLGDTDNQFISSMYIPPKTRKQRKTKKRILKMINIKSIDKFLAEKKESKEKYEYGCVMLYFDFPEIAEIHDSIDTNDIYKEEGDRSFGLEDEPHTTLLYGLHEEVTTEEIESILSKYEFGKCKIYNASLFENQKYDVLKFDVKGKNLVKCNSDLSELPHTTDFPDYHPHLTIAYLSSGSGKKYTEMFEGMEFELIPSYAVYSMPSGDKVKIKIKKTKEKIPRIR